MAEDSFGYYQIFPENIREIFMWLCRDVADLRTKWNFYLELFSSEESTELLTDIAPASFQMIEKSLRREMIVAICRLSDPIKSGEKSQEHNLSLKTLTERLDNQDQPIDILEEFRQACRPVRIIRNKRLGHNDLDTRIKPQENPLPGIGKTQIEQIIVLAEQILNYVINDLITASLDLRRYMRAEQMPFYFGFEKEGNTGHKI